MKNTAHNFFTTCLRIISISSVVGVANAQITPPAAYTTNINVNMVRTWDATAPETSPVNLLTRGITDVKQVSNYTDGFGRAMESVSRQASPLGNDMVKAYTYDSWGRQVYQYLPFVSNIVQAGDVSNDGNFKMDPFQQQAAFLADADINSPIKGQGDTWYYSKTNYEASPQNRVLNNFAQGNNWVGTEGSTNHNTQIQRVLNTVTDNVRAWNIPVNVQNTIPTSAAAYGAGALNKIIKIDEQGHQIIEFLDIDNKLVLKKVQFTAANDNGITGSAHTGWLCTYYVYDDFGYLRFVLTPKLITQIDGSWIISQLQADELCYRFEYDLSGRMIIKKTPGSPSGNLGEIWMVYDQRNRIVMKQDGNLRALQKWEYLQYDNLDRPIAIGLLTDPSNYNNLSYHTTNASQSITWPVLSSYTTELLSQTFYDNYNWMSAGTSGTLPSTLDASTSGTGNANFITTFNTAPLYAQQILQSGMTRGQQTGAKSEVLGTNQAHYNYSVTFYDAKGRTIQIQNINFSGGKDIATMQYDWSGKVLTNVIAHNKALTNPETNIIATIFTYDQLGRLLTTSKSGTSAITNTATAQVTNLTIASTLIETNQYNELGQLKSKSLGASLETLTYDYNIRGWLLGVNRNYAKTTGSTSNYFGFDLGFDKTIIQPSGGGSIGSYATASLNGNVAGTVWKSKGDGVARKYDYIYDNSNQLNSAAYVESSVANIWDHSYLDFSVTSLSYDPNGNISGLSQNGFLLGGSQNIDNLAYNYLNSGTDNRLQNVLDNSAYNVSNPQSLLGDFHYAVAKTSASVDFSYDANGNTISDINHQVQSIAYNYLNLPSLITLSNSKGTIQYVYDASGNKLQKITFETSANVNYNGTNYASSITTTTTYIGNFVYQSKAYGNAALASLQYVDQLLYITHEQGRIRFIPALGTAPANLVFDYFIRDNLGSIRMTLTNEVQADTYPAATLETASYNGGVAEAVESQYYTINTSDIINTTTLPWWGSLSGGSYQNQNNGGSPANPDPYSNTSVNSTQVYQLNGNSNSGTQSGDRFGLGITLKVMSGDKVSIFGKSVYHLPSGQTIPTGSYPMSAILSSFLSAFATTSPVNLMTHGSVTGVTLNNSTATTGPLTTDLNNVPAPGDPTHTPKAGINWILFDDQFRPKASGFDPVNTTSDIVKNHNSMLNIPMIANGYLYVYCSNESNINVYFDNLQVVQTRGPIVEEAHYYPQGLLMSAISDHAWNKQLNFSHYQGKEMQNQEFSDGTGMEEYDFGARFYDPQLARWPVQDPAKQFASPYMGMANSWPNGIDKDGRSWLGNWWRIAVGLFAWNNHRTIGGNLWAIISRTTFESPQQVGGTLIAGFTNLIGAVKNVSFFDGALVLNSTWLPTNSAFTLGNVITGGPEMQVSEKDHIFQHEYGRVLQSQAQGVAYLAMTALPSLFDNGSDPNGDRYARDGNARSLQYFAKFYGGDAFVKAYWDFDPGFIGGNPISGYNPNESVYSLDNQAAIEENKRYPGVVSFLGQ